jgi:hypothetical protein
MKRTMQTLAMIAVFLLAYAAPCFSQSTEAPKTAPAKDAPLPTVDEIEHLRLGCANKGDLSGYESDWPGQGGRPRCPGGRCDFRHAGSQSPVKRATMSYCPKHFANQDRTYNGAP